MIKGDGIKEEVIKENIGSYILLGGHGLIDGIKYGRVYFGGIMVCVYCAQDMAGYPVY